MKRQLERLKGKRLVTGDPNLMTKDEICINATPNGGVEVKEIGTDGKIKDLAGSGDNGGGNNEEEHWIGVQFGNEDMGVIPVPICAINATELGREIGSIYINKGIGAIANSYTAGDGYSAFGGLLTYGDMVTPYYSHAIGKDRYYQLFCVNIKSQERIIYNNSQGGTQHVPIAPNYILGDFGDYTLEEIEDKILESKLFANYARNERIVAILSVIGLLVSYTGSDEWYGYTPIDEYLANAGIDMFTTLEIVYPNKDEMLEFAKQQVINYKG